MSSSLEKLFFQIKLIDELTAPANKVKSSLVKIGDSWRICAKEFVLGGAVAARTVSALHNLSAPARDFGKALGEVESLGVAREELDKLGEASRDFAARFGGDAVEIARSAYDIQSAIPGLAKGALAAFTTQGALLAKATKADAATITAYQGTMYSIFKREAETIGQAKWVDQLTGKTAKAVQIFKTTGAAMSAAFTNLGSTAKLSGVGIDEQMAVLGTLQSTMGGENAGTAYKAMLVNIHKAGKTLGMSFTDAQGKMLPVVEILEKIKQRTGDGELKAADMAALVSAFGKQGAQAVTNLLGKTDELRGSIGELNKVESSLNASEMADKMVDPLDKFHGQLQSLKIVFGQALLPVVNMLLWAVTKALQFITWLMEAFPPLRWAITGVTAVLLLAVGALTALKIAVIIKNSLLALDGAWRILNASCRKAIGISLKQIGVWIWEKTVMRASKTVKLACAAAQWLLNSSFWAGCVAAWSFTAALLACPLTWIVIGIVALVAGLVLLVVYWDKVKAAFLRFWEFVRPAVNTLGKVLLWLVNPIGMVLDAFLDWDKIRAFFGNVVEWVKSVFDRLGGALSAWWDKLMAPIRAVVKFFGGGDAGEGEARREPKLPESSGRGRDRDVAAGGIRSSTVNRTNNYGGVTINAAHAPRAGELEEYLLLQGGV